MGSILKTIIDIALLRSGPQALPASNVLAVLAVAAHLVTGLLHGLVSLPPQMAVWSALLGTLVVVAVVHGLLVVTGRGVRTRQTLTALAGCEVLVGLLALPLAASLGENVAGPAGLLLLALLGWNLAIAGHVFRHALDMGPFAGLALALGYMMLSFVVIDAVMPAP